MKMMTCDDQLIKINYNNNIGELNFGVLEPIRQIRQNFCPLKFLAIRYSASLHVVFAIDM